LGDSEPLGWRSLVEQLMRKRLMDGA